MSDSLKDLLSKQTHQQIRHGQSGVEVYFLPELSAYLKIGEIRKNSDLLVEQYVLEWLDGKINVPRVLSFEVLDNGREYIMLSEIPGRTYSDDLAKSKNTDEIKRFVEQAAVSIRAMHNLSITDCPFNQRLKAKFKKADENILGGFVDESDFEVENQGKTARQVFEELMSSKPAEENLVFTHGDLCLPNIIVCDRDVSGFIDLGRAGVADRYQDLALFLRSFRYNSPFDLEIENAFCVGYGIEELDREKIDFYRKLDELF